MTQGFSPLFMINQDDRSGNNMNSELTKINDVYLQIQDSLYPPPGFLDVPENQIGFFDRMKDAKVIYQKMLKKLEKVVRKLSPQDIIDGYESGCRLLQSNLSGYMYEDFRKEYVPVMLKSIKNDHVHTTHIFFRALVMYAPEAKEELRPLVIKALKSKHVSVIHAALSSAYQLRLDDALPIIKEFANHTDHATAEMATNILTDWMK